MSKAWNTKYGPRRVREEPPALEEAIFAARGLTDDLEAQAEIAASLMGVPVEQVRVALAKAPPRKEAATTVAFSSTRGGGERAVVVERKPRRAVTSRPQR